MGNDNAEKFEVQKDCQFYKKETCSCNALRKLYCKSEKCSFYKQKEETESK